MFTPDAPLYIKPTLNPDVLRWMLGFAQRCNARDFEASARAKYTLLSDSRQSFKTPVLVPFPQADIWTVAFVSGNIPAAIAASLPEGERYLPVYVPTTPNPTGGYYIMVRQRDIRPLSMSVDDALKYVISLGMVMPDTPAQNSIAPPTAD